MKINLDEKSYIKISYDNLDNIVKISLKTKLDKKSFMLTAELNEKQVVKLITELISIKANMYEKS